MLNSREAIVTRAASCEAERGARPNFIAVNFAGIGQAVEAVATINGVGEDGRAGMRDAPCGYSHAREGRMTVEDKMPADGAVGATCGAGNRGNARGAS